MNGHVDSAGRALVRIGLMSAAAATTMEVEAWIDTGFTGELVLPQDQIVALGLPQPPPSSALDCYMAIGSPLTMPHAP